MASTTLTMNLVSQLQETIQSSTFGDWALTFTYKGEVGKQVASITVTGVLASQSAYLNYNVLGLSTNISFNNTTYDEDLIDSVKSQIDIIMAPVVDSPSAA